MRGVFNSATDSKEKLQYTANDSGGVLAALGEISLTLVGTDESFLARQPIHYGTLGLKKSGAGQLTPSAMATA